MTFDEYIKNPMGKATVMSNLQMYNQLYTDKWNKIMVRENGKIIYKLYKGKTDYYAHFKIPSEVVPKFYYDVVVRFYIPKGKSIGIIRSLSKYDVQFYSNDPNFVFTFVHAFNKHNMFIKDLEGKMSSQALKVKAVEKNPKDEIGYVKSLYFMYLAIKSLDLFSKSKWETLSHSYSKNIWTTSIKHADDKIRDRQELGAAIEKKERRNRVKENRSKLKENIYSTNNDKSFKSPNIKNFGHFKKQDFNKIESKPKSTINKFKKLFK